MVTGKRIIVIGGLAAAGTSAASKARRVDPNWTAYKWIKINLKKLLKFNQMFPRYA